MLAFGKDGVLKPDEIVDGRQLCAVAVGPSDPQGLDAAKGEKIFAENCVACHGDGGKGNPEMGAPNLTDKIWLYGSDEAS